MNLFKEKKTKRIYVRMTPSDHQWLLTFAKKRETKISKLFMQFIDLMKTRDREREDADAGPEV